MTVATQPTIAKTVETTETRPEEIVRRYWLRGELTPLALANSLARHRVAVVG